MSDDTRPKTGRPKLYAGTEQGAPQLTVRLNPAVHQHIKAQAEGPRAYIEGVVAADMTAALMLRIEEAAERLEQLVPEASDPVWVTFPGIQDEESSPELVRRAVTMGRRFGPKGLAENDRTAALNCFNIIKLRTSQVLTKKQLPVIPPDQHWQEVVLRMARRLCLASANVDRDNRATLDHLAEFDDDFRRIPYLRRSLKT